MEDVNRLMEYAPKRIKSDRNDFYATMLNIVSVGSFHEKGADKQYEALMRQFQSEDANLRDSKLDVKGLEQLAALTKQHSAQLHKH